MHSHNAEDETQGENENNDGVDLESGGLVGVELQHGTAASAGAGSAGAGGAGICCLSSPVGGGLPAHNSLRTSGDCRR